MHILKVSNQALLVPHEHKCTGNVYAKVCSFILTKYHKPRHVYPSCYSSDIFHVAHFRVNDRIVGISCEPVSKYLVADFNSLNIAILNVLSVASAITQECYASNTLIAKSMANFKDNQICTSVRACIYFWVRIYVQV